MKKLLLVMLVPVLVLGLFSCGKVADYDMMAFDLQGTWTNGDIVMVLAGNEATIKSSSSALKSAAYRVEVSVTTLETVDNNTDGTIKFVGFKDKKAAEIATVNFTYHSSSSLEITDVKRADDAISYLLPSTGNYSR